MRIHTQNKSTTTASLLLAEQPSHWEAVRRRAFRGIFTSVKDPDRKPGVIFAPTTAKPSRSNGPTKMLPIALNPL